jgi:hypothetical protein
VKRKHNISIVAFFTVAVAFSACTRLDLIEYSPKMTPEMFLAAQPHWHITVASVEFVLTQPSSTLIVYTTGLLTIGIGIRFLRARHHQRTRLWWGIGLMLSGIGAFLAGTSYQAFGYEIKCGDREFCTWTSWWEVAYLLFTAAGMNALFMAVAYSCAMGTTRKALFVFAFTTTVAYITAVFVGAFVPVRFLVSFECLLLASVPAVLLALLITGRAFCRQRDHMTLSLLGTWFVFVLVMIAYLLALFLNITPYLWTRNIWFTENDVLHCGFILWVLFIAVTLPKNIRDMSKPEETMFIVRK